MVNSIINPFISLFLKADAAGEFGIPVPNIYGETVTFPIGDLISAIISFLAVAAVVYFGLRTPDEHLQGARRGTQRHAGRRARGGAGRSERGELLVEIRDLLKAQRGA